MPHHHLFIPGAEPSHTPLLLLHGSGRTEQDMVPLAAELAPRSMAVAVRGAVPWESGFAFFRRFEDRAIDERDLLTQAGSLAKSIAQIGIARGFARPPVAVGFSNGAIMAAALIMLEARLLSGAVLFRPLSPFAADPARKFRLRRCSSSTDETTSAARPVMAPGSRSEWRVWARTSPTTCCRPAIRSSPMIFVWRAHGWRRCYDVMGFAKSSTHPTGLIRPQPVRQEAAGA
ncbi:alpha/beta hydrolase [Bradyrhizobium sp.]|uniref:alpha/beta hydrolase n=1 Tax=Bradyrhizobium sp. TaxID=376 RepID=UPI0025C5DC50|nr:hypothetical protein [Bradyrhizobium sp.]MBV8921518.1 hypothetical protein [Bradyrhizobium sp.]